MAADRGRASTFYDFFRTKSEFIKHQLQQASSPATSAKDQQEASDSIAQLIGDLSRACHDNAFDLPLHDQQSYVDTLRALGQQNDQLKSAAQPPRAKFSFKKKRAQAAAAPPTPSTTTAPPAIPHAPSSASRPQQPPSPEPPLQPDDAGIARPHLTNAHPRIAHHTSSHIIPFPPPASAPLQTLALTSLTSSIISLQPLTTPSPLATLTIRAVASSLLSLGRVDGAVHASFLHDTVLSVSARQFRLHDSHGVDVYLAVASQPVIERCSRIRFAPLPRRTGRGGVGSAAPAGDQGGNAGAESLWSQVLDFQVLGQVGASPNWSVLPAEERAGEELWRAADGVDKEAVAGGRERILAAAGISMAPNDGGGADETMKS